MKFQKIELEMIEFQKIKFQKIEFQKIELHRCHDDDDNSATSEGKGPSGIEASNGVERKGAPKILSEEHPNPNTKGKPTPRPNEPSPSLAPFS
jgi:hypothetical protein